jgi:phosphonate transport system permease protein
MIKPKTIRTTDSAQDIRHYSEWQLHRAVTPKLIALLLLVFIALGWSAKNTELDRAAYETGEAVVALTGLTESKVLDSAGRFLNDAFPFTFESSVEISRIDNFDRDNLPLFARIETRELSEYDAFTETYTKQTVEYLVNPIGYLLKVLAKMWESIEMGFWGTFLSVAISLPLGILAAKNYSPNKVVYTAARTLLGFHRAMPELIIALFFVLMYGFGPIAGIFALAIHTSGVLGKFFSDEIENAPVGPQSALKASGAGSLKVLRFAVFPQVFPAYVAYIQYIFERNIRTATILGMVGAGGIGMELKGRWDLFDYSHVATILLIIFLTVMALEFVSQKIRGRSL